MNDKDNVNTIDLSGENDEGITLTLGDMSHNLNGMSYSDLTYSGGIDSITLPTPTTIIGAQGSGSTVTPTWTIGSSNTTWANITTSTHSHIDRNGTLELNGDNADIKINGDSLMQTLRDIQDRLNILRPNTELEAKWDQLRELGEQYRALESEIKEKQKMWDTLKAMPPPNIPE